MVSPNGCLEGAIAELYSVLEQIQSAWNLCRTCCNSYPPVFTIEVTSGPQLSYLVLRKLSVSNAPPIQNYFSINIDIIRSGSADCKLKTKPLPPARSSLRGLKALHTPERCTLPEPFGPNAWALSNRGIGVFTPPMPRGCQIGRSRSLASHDGCRMATRVKVSNMDRVRQYSLRFPADPRAT